MRRSIVSRDGPWPSSGDVGRGAADIPALEGLALAQRRLEAMQEILRRIKVHLERGGRISRADRDLLLASISAHLARAPLA